MKNNEGKDLKKNLRFLQEIYITQDFPLACEITENNSGSQTKFTWLDIKLNETEISDHTHTDDMGRIWIWDKRESVTQSTF